MKIWFQLTTTPLASYARIFNETDKIRENAEKSHFFKKKNKKMFKKSALFGGALLKWHPWFFGSPIMGPGGQFLSKNGAKRRFSAEIGHRGPWWVIQKIKHAIFLMRRQTMQIFWDLLRFFECFNEGNWRRHKICSKIVKTLIFDNFFQFFQKKIEKFWKIYQKSTFSRFLNICFS